MSSNDESSTPVKPGQVWEDRDTRVTVVRLTAGGGAIVRLPSGESLPVVASYFTRARLVAEA